MKTKNISKVLALSVLGLLTLTACDDTITARPTEYNEALISTPSFNEEIYNNIASVVYDSIENDGIGSDVLNEILYLYSVSTFGPLNSKVKVNNNLVGDSEITLKDAANDASKIDAFVLAHKAYWDDSTAASHEGSTATASEKARVIAKYNTIEERIAEEMYSKISSGSYSERHLFYEDRFLRSLYSSMESVAKPSTATTKPAQPILPDVEPKDVFDNYLTRANYDEDNRYIIDKVVPGIYRQLLTEQYLVEETYNTLGRSYAREVNIIKFTTNDNYPNTGFFLASKLVSEINDPNYSSGIIASYEADPDVDDGLLKRFKDYSKAQIGIAPDGSAALAILEDEPAHRFELGDIASAVSDAKLVTPLTEDLNNFYNGTDYGELAYKYIKMRDFGGNGVNSDLENSFTNSGAYSYEIGLAQQKMELQEKDYTTNGWYVKNGGLTDLPEAIRSRLFNIGVATGVLEKPSEKTDPANNRAYVDGKWVEAANENAYVCRINGHYYLKNSSRVKGDLIDNDILHYDESSKSYYIVEVKQAVSSSKLAKNGDRNYARLVDDTLMQTITNEVTKVVGKGDTYTTLATKKYLKAMNIKYHDQSVYDYFKTNYPELFGEEASSDDSAE